MAEQVEPPIEAEDVAAEDLATQLAKIADQIAELSAAEAAPSGFKIRSDPFEASEVDFSSNGWLLRVLQVQAWLNPDTEVEAKAAEVGPLLAAKNLFGAIAAVQPENCVREVNDLVLLTQEGADYLSGRLDTAVNLQQEFQESLEELTTRQATAQWRERWEESDDAPAATEPIQAQSATRMIVDFEGMATAGVLNLSPSYQRGDVWPTRDAQKLIESILRGIPLPSIILLSRVSKKKEAMWEVVDGKQRLTTILRFIGKHPEAVRRVEKAHALHPEAHLKEYFSTDYKRFRRLWKAHMAEALTDRREAQYYFPFRLAQNSPGLRGPLSALGGKYYHQITDTRVEIAGRLEPVLTIFERSSAYKVPIIEYENATHRQIHEVFHLYNRQGKHLNAEEIRNALFHEIDLVRLVLAASGDNTQFSVLIPFVPTSDHPHLKEIAECLEEYRFGSARYKRTKVLSWLLALLFQPAVNPAGELTIRSTAKHIDALLTAIEADGRHKLANQSLLVGLVRDVSRCLGAHSENDNCWDPRFKDDQSGTKWQELQLVASLVGVFLIGVVTESLSDVLERHRTELLRFTEEHRRPEKTQNSTQWAFIAEVALGLVATVGVDELSLEAELLKRYGVSCLPTLRKAKAQYRPRATE